jgi:hypothetical protein
MGRMEEIGEDVQRGSSQKICVKTDKTHTDLERHSQTVINHKLNAKYI